MVDAYLSNLKSNIPAVILGTIVLFIGISFFYNQFNCDKKNFVNSTASFVLDKGQDILFVVSIVGVVLVVFDLLFPEFSNSDIRKRFGLTKCVAVSMAMMILASTTLSSIAEENKKCDPDGLKTVKTQSIILNSVICSIGVYILFKAVITNAIHMQVYPMMRKEV